MRRKPGSHGGGRVEDGRPIRDGNRLGLPQPRCAREAQARGVKAREGGDQLSAWSAIPGSQRKVDGAFHKTLYYHALPPAQALVAPLTLRARGPYNVCFP